MRFIWVFIENKYDTKPGENCITTLAAHDTVISIHFYPLYIHPSSITAFSIRSCGRSEVHPGE